MFRRSKFRTKQARRRAQKRLAIQSAVGLVVLLLLSVGLTQLLSIEALRIQDVRVETDGALTTNEIAERVSQRLDGVIAHVLPRDSAFFIRTKALEDELRKAYPRADSVRVRRSGLQALAIHIHERIPAALWCGDVVPPIAYTGGADARANRTEEAWGTCYQIDARGYLYARAPIYTGNIFPRYYGSLEHGEPIGQQYLPEDEFVRWQHFFAALHEETLDPLALLLLDEHDVELYLGNGLRVFIPRDDDLDLARRRLLATLSEGGIDPARNVEYLDLRFGNKAFVRYFDDTAAQATETRAVRSTEEPTVDDATTE